MPKRVEDIIREQNSAHDFLLKHGFFEDPDNKIVVEEQIIKPIEPKPKPNLVRIHTLTGNIVTIIPDVKGRKATLLKEDNNFHFIGKPVN